MFGYIFLSEQFLLVVYIFQKSISQAMLI